MIRPVFPAGGGLCHQRNLGLELRISQLSSCWVITSPDILFIICTASATAGGVGFLLPFTFCLQGSDIVKDCRGMRGILISEPRQSQPRQSPSCGSALTVQCNHGIELAVPMGCEQRRSLSFLPPPHFLLDGS